MNSRALSTPLSVPALGVPNPALPVSDSLLTKKSRPVQRLPLLFVTDVQAGSLAEKQVHRLFQDMKDTCLEPGSCLQHT